MAKKKTTLMMEESLYQQARIEAAKRNISVSVFVAEAVATYVTKADRPKKEIKIPVFNGTGGMLLPPHVDPTSNVQIADYLDELDGLAERR